MKLDDCASVTIPTVATELHSHIGRSDDNVVRSVVVELIPVAEYLRKKIRMRVRCAAIRSGRD